MKRCIKGCEDQATRKFCAMIPATGYPSEFTNLVTLGAGMFTCEKHMDEVKPEHFLSDYAIKRILNAMTSKRIPPDFERAFLQWTKLQ